MDDTLRAFGGPRDGHQLPDCRPHDRFYVATTRGRTTYYRSPVMAGGCWHGAVYLSSTSQERPALDYVKVGWAIVAVFTRGFWLA